MEIDSLTLLEARSLKSSRAVFPPGTVGKDTFLPLLASGDFWHGILGLVAASLQSLPPSSHGLHLFLSSLLSLKRTLGVGFKAHLENPGWSHLKILNLMTSVKTLFSNKATFTGSGYEDVHTAFGRPPFNSLHPFNCNCSFSFWLLTKMLCYL